MKTKTFFLFTVLLFAIASNATVLKLYYRVYKDRQFQDFYLHVDTIKKPILQTATSTDLKAKMLGIWRDVESENATFEIKPNSIYYFEHGASYKYNLKGNVLSICFPDYTFTGKVSFGKETMVIDSKEYGVSKYKRMK